MEDSVQLPRIYMAWHSTPSVLEVRGRRSTCSRHSRRRQELAALQGIAVRPADRAGRLCRQPCERTGRPVSGHGDRKARPEPRRDPANHRRRDRQAQDDARHRRRDRARLCRVRVAVHPRACRPCWGRPNSSIGMRRSSTIPATWARISRATGSVTAADVQQAAREYLTDKRVVLSVVPRRTPPAGTTAAQKPADPFRLSAAPQSAPAAAPAAKPAQVPRRRSGPGRWICPCCRRGARSEADAAGRAASPAVQRAGRPGGRAPRAARGQPEPGRQDRRGVRS